MTQVVKIALPGYNALTDTDPDHFALYVDQLVDYVLIKEKTRDTISVTTSETIAHNLGYVPMCLVFAEVSSGVWRRLYSQDIGSFTPHYTIDSTNLTLLNSGGAKQFSYHIFYDNIT